MDPRGMVAHEYLSEKGFEFEAGGKISRLRVVYHSSPGGHEGKKVIWICHALTANSDAEDWWPEMVGPGKFLDTEKYFIVCCNMLGSCYGSSGPASADPSTGEPYFFNFPKATVRDSVRAHNMVREALGIEQIDLVIGSSIGGFQAIEWAVMYPDIVKNAFFIATLARVTPWLTAFEESQRMAIEADETFFACRSLEGGRKGLECARSIAMISYRAEIGYNLRQEEPSPDTMFAARAGSYQRHQGEKLSRRFDAYSYWYLSYQVDSNNAGRGRGGVAEALSQIKARTSVISIDTDLIFPPYEMEEMARCIPGAEYSEIHSYFGHDGFLLEYEQLQALMRPAIEKL